MPNRKKDPASYHTTGTSTLGRVTNGAVRNAYWAGVADGKSEAQTLLNLAARTNHNLWSELLHLDSDQPVGGTGVTLSYVFVEHLISLLRESHKFQAANKLAKRLEKSQAATRELLEKLERFGQELDTGSDK